MGRKTVIECDACHREVDEEFARNIQASQYAEENMEGVEGEDYYVYYVCVDCFKSGVRFADDASSILPIQTAGK